MVSDTEKLNKLIALHTARAVMLWQSGSPVVAEESEIISESLQELIALREDKKRLDWLSSWEGNLCTPQTAANGELPWALFGNNNRAFKGNTLREVIDAAMAQEEV